MNINPEYQSKANDLRREVDRSKQAKDLDDKEVPEITAQVDFDVQMADYELGEWERITREYHGAKKTAKIDWDKSEII